MEEKSRRYRLAPLQKVLAEPVTDPAEQVELDEQRHREPNVARTRGTVRSSETAAPSAVAELCRQLPAEDRSSLLVRMAALLSPEAQLDLIEQLATGFPADIARQLEEELRARLAK
jgi:hypothetical protein